MDPDCKRIVQLRFPSSVSSPKRDQDLWLVMIDQYLTADYQGYTIEIISDQYDQTTSVIITFASQEDAAFFKLAML